MSGSSSRTTTSGEAGDGSKLQQLHQQRSAAQLEQHTQSSLGEYQAYQLGFEVAASEADNPHAFCLHCPIRARLLMVHQCTSEAKVCSANMQQQLP
jgi:hypothetical protein